MSILETPLDEYERAYADWFARKRTLVEAGRWSAAFNDYPYAVHAAAPHTPLKKPIENCRIGLLTTGGVHLASQNGFDLSDPEGDLSWRAIPIDARPSDVRLSHRTYEKAWAARDLNVVLPMDRVREMAEEGDVLSLSAVVSMMGSITNVPALVRDTLPAIVSIFSRAGTDAALLVPL